jgi:hypothetical protein
MKKITTRTAEYTPIEGNLFLCRLFNNSEITAQDTQENFEAMMEIAGHKPYAVLVDARVDVTLTKEALENSTRPEMTEYLIANAILVNSLANRIVGNFMIRFNKSAATTRVFVDYDTAIKWLRKRTMSENKIV